MNGSDQENVPPGARIPLVEERLRIAREALETGHVHVATRVEHEDVAVQETLVRTAYRVERVPVDRIVDAVPPVRSEAGRTVLSVTEEVLVKRLRVIEEIHLIEERSEQRVDDQVVLRRTTVAVTRDD